MRAAAAAALIGAAFLLGGCQYLFGLTPPIPPVIGPIGGSFDPGAFGSFDPGGSGSFDPGAFGSFDPRDPGSFAPDDPGFSLPPPLATFTKGSATATIAGTAFVLDHLSAPGTSYADFGTEVGWTDGRGVYVHYFGTSAPGAPAGDGFVTIDRIRDGQHWSTADPEACIVKVTQDNVKGLAGSASCKGMRWADTMGSSTDTEPAYIDGEPAFDAKVTFKATP